MTNINKDIPKKYSDELQRDNLLDGVNLPPISFVDEANLDSVSNKPTHVISVSCRKCTALEKEVMRLKEENNLLKENLAVIAVQETRRNTEQLQKEMKSLKCRMKLLEAGNSMNSTLKTGEKLEADGVKKSRDKEAAAVPALPASPGSFATPAHIDSAELLNNNEEYTSTTLATALQQALLSPVKQMVYVSNNSISVHHDYDLIDTVTSCNNRRDTRQRKAAGNSHVRVASKRLRSQAERKSRDREAHQMLPSCSCVKDCSKKVSESQRVELWNEFWNMGPSEQREWINGQVVLKNKSLSTTSGHSARNYTLEYRMLGIRICKTFFTNTIGLKTDSTIRTALGINSVNQSEEIVANRQSIVAENLDSIETLHLNPLPHSTSDKRGRHEPSNKRSKRLR